MFLLQPNPGKDRRPSEPSSAASVTRATQGPPSVVVGSSPKSKGQRTDDVPVSVACVTVESVLFF